MPPLMPTTILMMGPAGYRRRPAAPGGCRRARGSLRAREAELVLVDLAQRDRQRLFVDGGLDERADVVEEAALVEVGVVVVDLPSALRGEDYEAVLRVHLRQQLVDRGVDDAFGSRHVSRPSTVQPGAAGIKQPLSVRPHGPPAPRPCSRRCGRTPPGRSARSARS